MLILSTEQSRREELNGSGGDSLLLWNTFLTLHLFCLNYDVWYMVMNLVYPDSRCLLHDVDWQLVVSAHSQADLFAHWFLVTCIFTTHWTESVYNISLSLATLFRKPLRILWKYTFDRSSPRVTLSFLIHVWICLFKVTNVALNYNRVNRIKLLKICKWLKCFNSIINNESYSCI